MREPIPSDAQGGGFALNQGEQITQWDRVNKTTSLPTSLIDARALPEHCNDVDVCNRIYDIPVILCPKDQQLLKHITLNCVGSRDFMEFPQYGITLCMSMKK